MITFEHNLKKTYVAINDWDEMSEKIKKKIQ